jgi:prevent-host-death family protein
MPSKWQMQDAKAKFSEVVRRAHAEGPQIVTHRGAETAVVLSIEEYRRLSPAKKDFVDFLLSGPRWDDEVIEMINDRSRDTGRDIEL